MGLAVSPALFASSAVVGGGPGFTPVRLLFFKFLHQGSVPHDVFHGQVRVNRLMISISTSRGMVVGVLVSQGPLFGRKLGEKLASCLVLSFLKLSRNNLSQFLGLLSPSFGLERVSVLYEKLTVLLLFSVAGTWQRKEGSKSFAVLGGLPLRGWPRAGHARLPCSSGRSSQWFLGRVLSLTQPEAEA